MIQDPPATGSAELNSFLVDVKNAINTAAKPLAGWKLSDFEAGVSEVISDKRDLIDIVTAWDDLVNIRNNFETEVARYEALYSDSKVLGNQYQEYADTFSQIMEWWDQNVRLIEDIEAFMIEVNADTSAAASSASAAATSETNAKTSETNAEDSASSASSSASSAENSASAAASSASAAATSEANADESENVALDASAAAIVAAINVAQYTGEGFPEGKVSAPVGSIYTDTAATNGAIRWIKTSGTGNTGWKVEYGDTGWRALVEWDSDGEIITGEVPTTLAGKIGPTPGQEGGIYLRREGNTVHGTIAGATSINYSNVYFALPVGFRQAVNIQRTYYRTKYHASSTQAAYILISGSTALYILQLDSGGPVAGPTYAYNASTFSYPAEAGWPPTPPWNPSRNAHLLP